MELRAVKTQDPYSFKSTVEKKYKIVRKANIVDILESYLIKDALESAKEIKEAEDIWVCLKDNFGDPNVMLKQKMKRIHEAAQFANKKVPKEMKDSLISLVNNVTDILQLVKDSPEAL